MGYQTSLKTILKVKQTKQPKHTHTPDFHVSHESSTFTDQTAIGIRFYQPVKLRCLFQARHTFVLCMHQVRPCLPAADACAPRAPSAGAFSPLCPPDLGLSQPRQPPEAAVVQPARRRPAGGDFPQQPIAARPGQCSGLAPAATAGPGAPSEPGARGGPGPSRPPGRSRAPGPAPRAGPSGGGPAEPPAASARLGRPRLGPPGRTPSRRGPGRAGRSVPARRGSGRCPRQPPASSH